MANNNNNTEIERKYLVIAPDYLSCSISHSHIAQGYICKKAVTARIRIDNNRGFLTIKGKKVGNSCFEWEREIPLSYAKWAIDHCSGVVEKIRYIVPWQDKNGNPLKIEVDVFQGANLGLVIAEIELDYKEQQVDTPTWIGKDVTTDYHYRNSYLSQCPYHYQKIVESLK